MPVVVAMEVGLGASWTVLTVAALLGVVYMCVAVLAAVCALGLAGVCTEVLEVGGTIGTGPAAAAPDELVVVVGPNELCPAIGGLAKGAARGVTVSVAQGGTKTGAAECGRTEGSSRGAPAGGAGICRDAESGA